MFAPLIASRSCWVRSSASWCVATSGVTSISVAESFLPLISGRRKFQKLRTSRSSATPVMASATRCAATRKSGLKIENSLLWTTTRYWYRLPGPKRFWMMSLTRCDGLPGMGSAPPCMTPLSRAAKTLARATSRIHETRTTARRRRTSSAKRRTNRAIVPVRPPVQAGATQTASKFRRFVATPRGILGLERQSDVIIRRLSSWNAPCCVFCPAANVPGEHGLSREEAVVRKSQPGARDWRCSARFGTWLVVLALVALPAPSEAAERGKDLTELDLEDLMTLEITAAAKHPQGAAAEPS